MPHNLSRRDMLVRLSALGVSLAGAGTVVAQEPVPIAVYKDPNCGCCAKWIEHMNASGFKAAVTDSKDMTAIKARYGVPEQLKSCHTTIVAGYVVEGHVPAADVTRLLKEKPKGIVGLTIPGMPASAPGMDMKPVVPYQVLTFDKAGKTASYAKHG